MIIFIYTNNFVCENTSMFGITGTGWDSCNHVKIYDCNPKPMYVYIKQCFVSKINMEHYNNALNPSYTILVI